MEYGLLGMVRQRVYALASDYWKREDHEELRQDAMQRLVTGKKDRHKDMAIESTLDRLELSSGMPNCYEKVHYRSEALDRLLLELFS